MRLETPGQVHCKLKWDRFDEWCDFVETLPPVHIPFDRFCSYVRLSLRVCDATSGDPDEADLVVLQDGIEVRRYDNIRIACHHVNTKVYSGEYFASDPPQWHWVCEMCGELGADLLLSTPEYDHARFWRLYKLFGHGER